MSQPHVLTIEIGRAKGADKPYEFDGTKQEYIARGPNGQVGTALFPWDEVSPLLRSDFGHANPSAVARKRMGELLRGFLVMVLKGLGGWDAYEQRLIESEGKGPRYKLRFRFSAAELFSLPWALVELTRNRSLGSIHPYPVLFEWVSSVTTTPPSREPPGRMLFAWSAAENPVEEERHLVALSQACPEFNPTEDVLEEVTLDSLRDALKAARDMGRPFRILHILCHGGRTSAGTFGLIWAHPDRKGRSLMVDGDRLRDVLAPFAIDLQAVVLSACHGGNPGEVGSTVGGVAHDLHRLGIPAVVASQMPLTVDGSIRLTRAFHESRCQKRTSLDEAFQAAHSALSAASLDWASLQLFMPSPPEPTPGALQRIVFSPAKALPELSKEVVVAYEVNFNVASAAITEALHLAGQGGVDSNVVVLHPLDRLGDWLPALPRDWARALKQAEKLVQRLGPRVDSVHLFGRAPLPLMFQLGWLLARLKLHAYQEQRGRNGVWECRYDSSPPASVGERFFREWTLPDREVCRAVGGRLAMTVEVYPTISSEDVEQWLGTEDPLPLVRLVVNREPSPSVLRDATDSAQALEEFRKCLDQIHADLPGVREIWLAMACPASLAAVLGRAYNPKTQATFKLFNFRKTEGYREVPWSGGVAAIPRRRS